MENASSAADFVIGRDFRRAEKKEEKEVVGDQVRDEYRLAEHPDEITGGIDALKPVVFEKRDRTGDVTQVDLTEQIRSKFRYISITKGLETGTERLQILQNYIDQMIADDPDWAGKVRLVVSNRGVDDINAYAVPDGTIVMSQALISMCSSIDEVVSVLAHEVGHLKNNTSENLMKAMEKTGLAWLHEMAADRGAIGLLDRLGLKTTAGADLCSKLARVSGNSRDAEHQASQARGAENIGEHQVIDYESSSVAYTPLPEELKLEPELTNLEMTKKAAHSLDPETFRRYFSKLHPRDLEMALRSVPIHAIGKNGEAVVGIQDIARQVIDERMTEVGVVDDLQKKLCWLLFNRAFVLKTDHNFGLSKIGPDLTEDKDPDWTAANQFYTDQLAKPVFEKLFMREPVGNIWMHDQEIDPLLELMRRKNTAILLMSEIQAVDLGAFDTFYLVDFVRDINSLVEGMDGGRAAEFEKEIHWIVIKHIKKFFLNNVEDYDLVLDKQQVVDLYLELKRVGYNPLHKPRFNDGVDNKFSEENARLADEAYDEVFGSREKAGIPRKKITPGQLISSLEGNEGWRASFSNLTELRYDESSDQLVVDNQFPQKVFPLDKTLYTEEEAQEMALTCLEVTRGEVSPREFYHRDRLSPEMRLLSNKLFFATRVFEEFPDLMLSMSEQLTQESGINWESESLENILEMSRFLFSENKGVDWDKWISLEIMVHIEQKLGNEASQCRSIGELLDYVKKQQLILKNGGSFRDLGKFKYFGDSPLSVFIGKEVVATMEELMVSQLIQADEYNQLYELLDTVFGNNDQRVESIKNAIQRKYLDDPTVPIEDKIDFYFAHQQVLGVEGATTVAEQIDGMDHFAYFRQEAGGALDKYLKGEQGYGVKDLFAYDFFSSMFLSDPYRLMDLSEDRGSKKARAATTDWATRWIDSYLNVAEHSSKGAYDSSLGKFVANTDGRSYFSSFRDMMTFLHELSNEKRVQIATKALTDSGGVLSDEGSKARLMEVVDKSLDLDSPFLREVLRAAIKDGNENILFLPLAKIWAPLLFEGADLTGVDYDRIKKEKAGANISNSVINYELREGGLLRTGTVGEQDYFSDLPRILESRTDELMVFGPLYARQPQSAMAELARGTNDAYSNIMTKLEEEFGISERTSDDQEKGRQTFESLISAGESSPVIVRMMQMAVQLFDFSPEVAERLATTQDSMRGMEKLRFWENLTNKTDRDESIRRLLEEDMVTLDGYLGGGSLFTTYGATMTDEAGGERRVVIKMLNPNAEEMIRLTSEFVNQALTGVAEHGKGSAKKDAALCKSLLELSRTWCIDDINDQNYVVMDDNFRRTIAAYNQDLGGETFWAPERVLTTRKVKVEEQCAGMTLNKYLRLEGISDQEKTKAVHQLIGFFEKQMNWSPTQNEAGEDLYIFHSDPHAGNYMIEEGADPRLAVIDRSMYLTLDESEKSIFQDLWEGRGLDFMKRLIDKTLEVNGVEDPMFKKKVMRDIYLEGAKQRLRGKEDQSAFLRVLLQRFATYEVDVEEEEGDGGGEAGAAGGSKTEKRRVEIPMKYRLMIRNVLAMQKLRDEYSVR